MMGRTDNSPNDDPTPKMAGALVIGAIVLLIGIRYLMERK